MGDRRGACKVLMANLKRRFYFEVIIIEGVIILKFIYNKYENMMGEWTLLFWLGTGKGDGLLRSL
jgi:hypothetical protein